MTATSSHSTTKCIASQSCPKGAGVHEMVACQICGIERKRLAAHIRAAHNMTTKQYRQQFPGSLVDAIGSRAHSDKCRAKQAVAALKRWADPDERVAQSKRLKISAPWLGKKLSDEHKQAISAGGLGLDHNLSDEDRQAMGERGRHVLDRIRDDPKVRAKLSLAVRRRFAAGELFGFRASGVHIKVMRSKVQNGTVIPPGGGRGITGFRKGLSHYCRSTLEANFARILAFEGVPYEYEPKVFLLPGGGRWTPDFYLPVPFGEIPAGWVELKGWRKKDGTLPGNATKKIVAFEKLAGSKVFVLVQSSKLWRQLEAKYGQIPLWERPGHNLRTHPAVFGRAA